MEPAAETLSPSSPTVKSHVQSLPILESLREAASSGKLTRSEALYWVRVASRAGLNAYDANQLDRAHELFQFAADFIRFATR